MTYSLVKGALVAVLFVGTAGCAQADLLQGLKNTLNNAAGTSSSSASSSSLSVADVTRGLKEALKVGSERVVGQLGRQGGFEADPAVHIPLPDTLQKAQALLRRFGLSGMADDLESRLNKAAEAAVPKTKELIWKAISEMTLEDANRIYNGPDDAATQYFRKVATPDLKETVRPVIADSLNDVGAIRAYDNLVGEFRQYPFTPDIRSDLTEHTTDLALEGLFHYLAAEEAAIRNNPVKRTTEILQSVFGR
ncbi:DUF4197 domain-containing protein [Sneathiella chinensis]|uniref:DUF4197 domain-containing protein n=1 Tax=Sneathiella chinensis TaxID=349750 RepID=A0ABQ5UB87_9PROT|nr:DUF4197 domain-containing protein [Sneathiella chinensis]GLQ07826.1 hypothetical protein GCM10007924_30480 [Sneathiella chinensis]